MFDRSIQVKGLPEAYRSTVFDPFSSMEQDFCKPDFFQVETDKRMKAAGATPEQRADIQRYVALLSMGPIVPRMLPALAYVLGLVIFDADETGEKTSFPDWRDGSAFLLPVPFDWIIENSARVEKEVVGIRYDGRAHKSRQDKEMAMMLAKGAASAASLLMMGHQADRVEERLGFLPSAKAAATLGQNHLRRFVLAAAPRHLVNLTFLAGLARGRYATTLPECNPRGAGRKKITDDPELVAAAVRILSDHKLTTQGRENALLNFHQARGETRSNRTIQRQLKMVADIFLNDKN